MAAIESLGLGSGVLTNDLVEKIIGATREASDKRLERDETVLDARITAYGEIKSLASILQSATSALSLPSTAGSTTASSSDESILTTEASILAEPGTYSVEVLNTAKAHSVVTDAYSSIDEIIGVGEIQITFGEITYDGTGGFLSQDIDPTKGGPPITIDDSNKTLSGIREAINNANIGAKASIINDGSGYRLVISSENTGENNAMRIMTLDDLGGVATTGLSSIAYNEEQNGAGTMTQTAKGEDALLKANGLTITRESNSIEEVVPGVTLNLLSADVGKPISIVVAPDTAGIQEKIQDFVNAYNEFKKFSDDLTSFNSDTEQAGLLLGDSTLRGIQSQVRSMISQPIEGLSGKFRSLTELGVNTDRTNDFLLDFDPAVFSKAMKEDRESIISILAKSGTAEDAQIRYVNDSVNTQPGTYGVEVTQLATQAIYQGGSVAGLDFSSPVTIDESNNNFTLNLNGKNEQITLTSGSYATGDELAKQIGFQINSNETYKKFSYGVTVDYDAIGNNFSITSNKYGEDSKISFTSTDSNSANTLGFNTLGKGLYEGVSLTTLGSDTFLGKGSTTQPGNRSVAESEGINFATSNATFSLDIGGGAIPVTVNLNAAGNDLNGDSVIGDRKDTLQAIQTAIDATALNGDVIADFDDNGFLTFTTSALGTAQQINLSNVGSTSSDTVLGLNGTQGVQTNGDDAGLTLGSATEFNMAVDGIGTTAKVNVPAGTYLTGADLAAAVELAMDTALSTDAAFAGLTKGGESGTGSRDISTAIDFSTANAGFMLNVSGVEKEIVVSGNDPDNIVNIQAALDSEFGAGIVTASLDGTGLKLASVATGHNEYLEVTSDGRGAQTDTSSAVTNITTGIDFSGVGNNATFTLAVDGVDINVDVNANGSAGTNDAASTLTVVQRALDTALQASGQFTAGDVMAKLDSGGNLFFETQSKNGVKTAATYGSGASIEVKNIDANASASLGLAAGTTSNGYDTLGFDDTRRYGYDVEADVSYVYDAEKDLGSLQINVGGNATQVSFTDIDPAAISILGLQDAATYSPKVAQGQNVEGKINGVEAKGNGQYLSATDGNKKASNGFYIANAAADFSAGVNLDATNNTFTIKVDGVERTISLAQPAPYNTGEGLAAALQAAINEDAVFKADKISVKVEYNDDPSSFSYQKFGIISASTGEDSSVEMVDVPGPTSAIFGFVNGKAEGETGKAQVGNIDPSSGIRMKITGGALGDRGSITYVSGFADQLNASLLSMLDSGDGLITNKLNALDNDKVQLAEKRERLETRMSAQEARLKSQFLYNDALVSKLNSTGDFITQQFEAMNNYGK
ncbi:Flagellar capping protein [Oleispira antarctica RB-8]|uniref:Filament cap protein n=1 Tax=Oleispira antarctica RB-8 TaxID=698738 RepID=R4YL36_OLEAN|nr:Flagellar capping protein [Oleispira antarctica RB-8]